LQSIIQKQAGGRWSRTKKCWYISCTQNNYEKFAKTLSGRVILETEELKKYLLEKKKTNLGTSPPSGKKIIVQKEVVQKKIKNIGPMPNYIHTISQENREALQQFTRQLNLKAYSPSTIRTYSNAFTQFLNTVKDKPAKEFTVSRLKDYLEYCFTKLKLSEATLHSRINALKFYYEQVLGKEKFFWEIPRPKKPDILPKVISKERIADLINSIENVKHRTIIMLAYACGLTCYRSLTWPYHKLLRQLSGFWNITYPL